MNRVILGDAVELLADMDLDGWVVVTDPPWPSGGAIDIEGAGDGALDVWDRVAAVISGADACVIYQSATDVTFRGPDMPYYQAAWMRFTPPHYRGTKLVGAAIAHVYGKPARQPGTRVHAPECRRPTSKETSARRHETPHPCPMQLEHARWLVSQYCYGKKVVDPFAGSGTVIQAAQEQGIEAIGFDIDPRWIDDANANIEAAAKQGLLFA